MNKQELLTQLRKGLSGLPQEDIEERVTFYSEMIEDQMEDGISEEDAVATIGSIDEIVAQTVADVSLTKIAKERIKTKKHWAAWEIVLLALGSPIWLSLGIAAVAVILSFYVVLWSLIISLWAIFVSLLCCGIGGVVSGILFICCQKTLPGVATSAAGLVCFGISIFAFYGCKAATNGILIFTKKPIIWIKNRMIRKEEV